MTLEFCNNIFIRFGYLLQIFQLLLSIAEIVIAIDVSILLIENNRFSIFEKKENEGNNLLNTPEISPRINLSPRINRLDYEEKYSKRKIFIFCICLFILNCILFSKIIYTYDVFSESIVYSIIVSFEIIFINIIFCINSYFLVK